MLCPLKTLHRVPLQLSFRLGSKFFHALKHDHHLFDIIPHPNAASVNHSMLNCLHSRLPFQALTAFKNHFQLHSLENVDEVTVALSLKACQGESKLGCQIHGFAALIVFENLSHPDIVSWNTVLSGFEESVDALNFARSMHFRGIAFDLVTYTSALAFCAVSACGHMNNLELGRQIHGLTQKVGYGTHVSVCNVLMSTYSKCEVPKDAKAVFECISNRNVVSWTTMISIQEEDAVSLFNAMRINGALLDMCGKRGDIIESQRVFNETPERTQFARTAIISPYARHGVFESVMSLYTEMEREGINPASITFLSVLAACCRKGMIDVGHRVFDSMVKKHSIEPTSEHYSIMVDMLGRVGRLDEAEELMHQIPGGPGLSVLQSLLGSCRLHGNMEMAEKVVGRLIEMDPASSGPYVLMANLYAEKGKWEIKMAKKVVGRLIEMDPASSGPYVLMANLYAEKGKWEIKMAKKVVGRLIEMDPASSGPYVLMANLYGRRVVS
ncbi:Pentatricopeptide repeat-containing protein, mitochondrial [Glycine soja]|uniref:Pentatricopeptide repeat-containing protein, mitochondrial n=1 Tax=Glycine soja TaxID=3848 RepID=A0A0B2NUG2_GLYSO|nr:Pentatricopeptide repeat-containing protein, mitochondrial [Glycine soja]